MVNGLNFLPDEVDFCGLIFIFRSLLMMIVKLNHNGEYCMCTRVIIVSGDRQIFLLELKNVINCSKQTILSIICARFYFENKRMYYTIILKLLLVFVQYLLNI
ncbi:hypothetical protein ACJIZ3_010486 [Penstemon smallii]|uniref:Uncharacterized protein n=1 Tax=Penstemon smallii TaxID=265156 RepID=A0ABD3TH38_9LAMI